MFQREWRRDAAAAVCGLAAAGVALGTTLLGACGEPGYVHRAQFISELGQIGASHARLVNFAGFLPVGLATLAFAGLRATRSDAPGRERWGSALFASVGSAYIVAAFLPCDPGCPAAGPLRQQVHNAFGLVEYVGGAVGLILIGSARGRNEDAARPDDRLALPCAAIVLAAFGAMLAPGLTEFRGVSQRAAETALFGWMAWASVRSLMPSAHAGSESVIVSARGTSTSVPRASRGSGRGDPR